MADMKTIKAFVNEYVDGLAEGATFNARGVARAYRLYILRTVGIPKLPYSDTIQRTLRERRAEKGDVNYFDYRNSVWWKCGHVATEEERCSRRQS